MEIKTQIFSHGARAVPVLPKVVRVLGPVPHRQFQAPSQPLKRNKTVEDKTREDKMNELYERLAILESHIKMADQAIEELDPIAARSLLHNALSTTRQCRELIEEKNRRSFSIKA